MEDPGRRHLSRSRRLDRVVEFTLRPRDETRRGDGTEVGRVVSETFYVGGWVPVLSDTDDL